MFVDAHVQNPVQRKYFCTTHVPDIVGWVRKRSWPDGTWKRRWMILHEGALYWYKRQTPHGSKPHLGIFRFAKECEEVLIMADKRMQSITWPKVAGVGIGILTIDGNVHGLHFETNTTCLRWKGRLIEVLETRSEKLTSTPRLTLGKPSSMGQAITKHTKSKWRNVWIRDVFWAWHLGCWGKNMSRIQHTDV